MSEQPISLKEAERRAFTTTFQDGLWDVLIGCFVLQLAIAPLLSARLGDLGSSAVFLPFWALVFLAIRLLRKRVVAPRAGMVTYGRWRRAKLVRFNLIIFVVLLAGLGLGALSARNVSAVPGWVHGARFGLIVLAAFSLAATFLDFPRLYLYGVLVALSFPVGEWLWATMRVPHHGFPVTFGVTALTMIVVGVVRFVRFLRAHPLPADGGALEGSLG